MQTLRLRTATNADADEIREIVFGALAEYGYQGDPEGYDTDLQDIEGNYLATGGMFVVAEDAAGHILGSVALFPEQEGVCEMRKMFLRPEARGQGLGARLLEYALSEARRLGFHRVTLQTGSRLTTAMRLYERYGFQPCTAAHPAARCDLAYALDLTKE